MEKIEVYIYDENKIEFKKKKKLNEITFFGQDGEVTLEVLLNKIAELEKKAAEIEFIKKDIRRLRKAFLNLVKKITDERYK